MLKHLHRWVAALAVLVLFTSVGPYVRAEDERDRKARVALALADCGKSADCRNRDVRAAMALSSAAESPAVAPAPRPKFKDVSHEEMLDVGFRKRAICPCGDSCDCAEGKCPAKCPTQPQPAQAVVTYREVWYTDGRRTWRQLEPVGSAGSVVPCPNGRCPVQR